MNRSTLKLVLVYLVLLAVVVCFHCAHAEAIAKGASAGTAQVTVERVDLAGGENAQVISGYYFRSKWFRGDWKRSLRDLRKYAELRRSAIERIEASALPTSDASWMGNATSSPALKVADRIAAWDAVHPLVVGFVVEDGKAYLTSVNCPTTAKSSATVAFLR